MQQSTMYQAAAEYINRGMAVFPLKENDKTPLTKNGFYDATTDAAQVKAWWQKWPNANIGIATGFRSGGIFVIDLDIDENRGIDGYHSLSDWERENGSLPETWRSITGTGGYHIFFRSDRNIGNRVRVIDSVDVRGDGGYIVAPPSIHPNGKDYQWEIAPEDMPIADADETVYKLLDTKPFTKAEFKVPEVIPDGQRNNTLFQLACSMQSKGLSDSAIMAAVKEENRVRCPSPLPDDEVEKIVSSACKYPKGGSIGIDQQGEVLPSTWRQPNLKRNDKGLVEQTENNAIEAIMYDKELFGKIKYNELAWAPFIYGEVPWEHENTYREWTNFDDSNLLAYLESKYGLRNKDKIMEGLNVVLNQNKFNPVIDMLETAYKNWDHQTGHIENLLPDYLGVEKTDYTTECMKVFMLGGINRAFYPGCKFDLMPVITGKQGIGKSTFFRFLSMNNAWFNDNFNTVDGDKAPEKIRGMWMVEMAELLAVKKAKEIESIKAFLTSTEDVYRPPYMRRSEQHPRMCVFVGTTNSNHFLTDRTGNRRYLPLQAREEYIQKSLFDDPESVQRDIENAWGEAMDLFYKANKKPKLTLPKKIEMIAIQKQSEYMEEDVRVGIIQEWLDNTVYQRVCAAMLYKEALENGDRKPSRYESTEILSIMDNCISGWRRIKNENSGRAKCGKYGTQICYERSDDFIPVSDDDETVFD